MTAAGIHQVAAGTAVSAAVVALLPALTEILQCLAALIAIVSGAVSFYFMWKGRNARRPKD